MHQVFLSGPCFFLYTESPHAQSRRESAKAAASRFPQAIDKLCVCPWLPPFNCYRVTIPCYNAMLQPPQNPTEQAAEPGHKQRPLLVPGSWECAGGKTFLENNAYVGRLPAPMLTWRHSGKGELCRQLKYQCLPGAGHYGARDNGTLCLTLQGRVSQTREQENALCRLWTSVSVVCLRPHGRC